MAQRTKGKQSKYWSYNTGERGRNWVRAYEDGRDGKLYLEWRDCGQRRRALLRDVQDTEVAKQRADRLAAELGEFQLPESPAPITLDELLRLYGKEVTPGKGGSKQAHDGRATAVDGLLRWPARDGEAKLPPSIHFGSHRLGPLHRGSEDRHDLRMAQRGW